ncbi:MAG: hypothetical protein M1816_000803 [Peltula sp. TS41687]|nr:MAG: hypothetical protein M1816_000803 [Peltula sp. TS41687]
MAISISRLVIPVYLHFRIDSALEGHNAAPGSGYPAVVRSRLIVSLLLLLLVPGFISLRKGEEFHGHPIDTLRSTAVSSHVKWLKQASTSRSLEEAVKNYEARYGLAPPPGFGEWYNYATKRNSTIIDDFDSIHNDLLPFWTISPQEIRLRTWELTSNPWNGVFPLKVRAGKIDLGPNRLPTHRWMMEGVQALIQPFAEHLPDMDLALNLNDESRVAVEWEELQVMIQSSAKQFSRLAPTNNTWSLNRADQWRDPFEETTTTSEIFEDHSFTTSFDRYTARTCPPSSRARRDPVVDKNWNLTGDVCHQPDLANLHGFFLSPAAFKTTRKLVPVFSQSRAPGYNDILYPSAWNYMDKVKYEPSDAHPDPPYDEKKTCLFWRGGTTEGFSHDGAWKGMVRQRLVWLTNSTHRVHSNLLLSPTHDKQSLIVTDTSTIPPADLPATDISIVEDIVRCAGSDCDEQAGLFALVGRVDFQDHWQYKYLFDLDGAGYSGRFISFLQSRSVPFKTALFHEWYRSRLTPWLHFVPLDLRLHDVYSTLAYFAGLTTTTNKQGRRNRLHAAPHHQEGEYIATQGRHWANKVLRKEDMEIYMFRLLLELGRLTDDRREELGFIV